MTADVVVVAFSMEGVGGCLWPVEDPDGKDVGFVGRVDGVLKLAIASHGDVWAVCDALCLACDADNVVVFVVLGAMGVDCRFLYLFF